jgi:hypothetical protein
MNLLRISSYLLIILFVLSCDEEAEDSLVAIDTPVPIFVDISSYESKFVNSRTSRPKYAIYMAEYLTTGENGHLGNTVFFKDVGNKQLATDFILPTASPAAAPFDTLSIPILWGSFEPEEVIPDNTFDISYYVDQRRSTQDLSLATSTAAINDAMSTWNNLNCSDIGLFEIPFDGKQTGFAAEFFGFGGSFEYVADVVHCGWMPGSFFEILAEGGSNFILGVTFTLVLIDDNGNTIDLDNNNKADVAFREIYYNDEFSWGMRSGIDVESVALHEAGHGLSQAHFGKAFITNSNQFIHFSPRAVMNAAIFGVQQELLQTDQAGHCSNWGP